ncbi:hypothetical protein LX36DRAFT_266128 [Colletotrichum falcatum]|nr:hypothetical protein LX36DRAFT_266128 [Colletotrichum falcatum]
MQSHNLVAGVGLKRAGKSFDTKLARVQQSLSKKLRAGPHDWRRREGIRPQNATGFPTMSTIPRARRHLGQPSGCFDLWNRPWSGRGRPRPGTVSITTHTAVGLIRETRQSCFRQLNLNTRPLSNGGFGKESNQRRGGQYSQPKRARTIHGLHQSDLTNSQWAAFRRAIDALDLERRPITYTVGPERL